MKTTSTIMLLFLLLMERTPHKSGVIDRNRKPQVLMGMSQEAALPNYSETLFLNIDMYQKTVNNETTKMFIDDQPNNVLLIKSNNLINNGKNLKSAKSPKTRDPSIHPEPVSGYGRSWAWEGLICKVKAPENSPGGSHPPHPITGFMNKYMLKFKDEAQTKNLWIVEDEGHTKMIILMEDYDRTKTVTDNQLMIWPPHPAIPLLPEPPPQDESQDSQEGQEEMENKQARGGEEMEASAIFVTNTRDDASPGMEELLEKLKKMPQLS